MEQRREREESEKEEGEFVVNIDGAVFLSLAHTPSSSNEKEKVEKLSLIEKEREKEGEREGEKEKVKGGRERVVTLVSVSFAREESFYRVSSGGTL